MPACHQVYYVAGSEILNLRSELKSQYDLDDKLKVASKSTLDLVGTGT